MSLDNAEDDIMADVRAAMGESAAADVAAPVEKPALEVSDAQTIPEKPATDGPARDQTGKFAKAPEAVQDAVQVTAEAPEPIRPPASWSAQAKADFATLPPHIQEQVVKRERDVDKGFQERAAERQKYEPLEAILAPHREEWTLAGITQEAALQQLLAAHKFLQRDPNGAIEYLRQQYGGSQAQTQQGQAFSPQSDPVVSQLQQQLQDLQSQMQQRETAEQQRSQSELQSQIAAFQADPANIYYENVKPHMASLLRSGQADTLQDAYNQAVWASPETRPLMLAQEQKAAQASVLKAAQDKARQAGQASGSLNGSASGNAVAASTGNSIEDDVRAAMASIGGRA